MIHGLRGQLNIHISIKQQVILLRFPFIYLQIKVYKQQYFFYYYYNFFNMKIYLYYYRVDCKMDFNGF